MERGRGHKILLAWGLGYLDMTIAYDWDVKHQNKQTKHPQETCILAYQIGISTVFTHLREFYFTNFVPAPGKAKKAQPYICMLEDK